MFGRRRKKPFDIIQEIEKIKQCLCCVGIECGKTDLRQFLSIIGEGEQYQVLTTLDDEIVWRDNKYVREFEASEWVANTFFIGEQEHRRGLNPIVQVYEFIDSVPMGQPTYYKKVPDTEIEIRVLSDSTSNYNGLVNIVKDISKPAFKGKLLIM